MADPVRESPAPEPAAAGPDGGAPYLPPALTRHGRIADLVRGGEGTNPDGGGVFAFSGAEP